MIARAYEFCLLKGATCSWCGLGLSFAAFPSVEWREPVYPPELLPSLRSG